VDWSEAFELVPSLAVGYAWHAGVHAAEVAQGLERIGFEIVAQVIWDKGLFALGRSWYHWRHEPCWVVRKKGAKVRFFAASAVRSAELDGVEPAPADDQAASRARAAELVADLVEPAKAEALDKLGEGRQALDIAEAWMRSKLGPAAAPETPPR
jgi:hypothetical protein